MKMIPATCQCGVEFLREPHDDYPRCSECFFEHDAPALKKLTDEVTEKRPGLPPRSTRTAHTETPERDSVMQQSTNPEAWGYAKKIRDAKGNELYTLALRDKLRITHPNNDHAVNADTPVDFYLYTRNANGEEQNRVFVNAKENGEFMGSIVATKTSLVEFAEWVIGQFTEEAGR